jgi:hypothetical protein
MCESTNHAGCELALLAQDYPSWIIVDRLQVNPPGSVGAGSVQVAEAIRGGTVLAATGAGRLERLRRELIRFEAGELA